ncbi:DEAD/DEAH box helicase [Flocculibacter collagenilyticus]|uniref:DEAD/DEAH box helicase n=1 Tax=Flocculibacter collagenilyticus TaxID=2744479 RepID=UPI0018F645A4|nr:DEAD/DEAH box helicase [Flocculibacter collagenilyticus]
MTSEQPTLSFQDLDLPDFLLKALEKVGYETPSPIQAKSIPVLMEGRDILGQAQTGTGKTAAFALPLLAKINVKDAFPQLLVLAPTRELAIQVAEAFQTYSSFIKGFHVLPIYGGQSYDTQIRALKRGVHVVVGTPGRVMDHIRKGTLKLDRLQSLVLDEADEMLRMGFIDDVDWILEHTPAERQTALFSATMPQQIKKIATNHLNNPTEIKIAAKTSTATTIRQRVWQIGGIHKLDALTRILETEDFDGVIIFVRTKTATVELSEKLEARGYASEPLNGDIAQKSRERTVEKLKAGKLDIIVATDVVARGLDVERISHVINYDIPYDVESYVHRIGRTGRAGRKGDAILFAAPRERRLLKAIERSTKQTIETMQMPSVSDINLHRVSKFKQRIVDSIGDDDLATYKQVVEEVLHDNEVDPVHLAAAIAKLVQGKEPLFLSESAREKNFSSERQDDDRGRRGRDRDRGDRPERGEHRRQGVPSATPKPLKDNPDIPMERFRVEVGHKDGVKPGNLVGAIANEGNLDSKFIGNIEIYEGFTLVDLPKGMDKETAQTIKAARVCGRRLELRPYTDNAPSSPRREGGKRNDSGKRSGPRDGNRQGGNKRKPRSNS